MLNISAVPNLLDKCVLFVCLSYRDRFRRHRIRKEERSLRRRQWPAPEVGAPRSKFDQTAPTDCLPKRTIAESLGVTLLRRYSASDFPPDEHVSRDARTRSSDWESPMRAA